MTIEIKTYEYPEPQLTEVVNFGEVWNDYADPDLGDTESINYEESCNAFYRNELVTLSEFVNVRRA